MTAPAIDRGASAARIERDIGTLAGPCYTLSERAIRRYAYTAPYRQTVGFVGAELEALGFTVAEDPVGNLVARNRPTGTPVWALGSHVDSNRNGGRFDGTLGVVAALEACRLDAELGLGLPLQVMAFVEEEGSGFGTGLLGSRIMAGRITEDGLRALRAIDDGRPFWDHAIEAGHEPGRWRESRAWLDGVRGWIEIHIEQGRVLQDAGQRIGVVDGIAGLVHGDLVVRGRADHAGATPMDVRIDPGPVAAQILVELERLARAAGHGTVGTAGELEARPGQITAIPESVRMSVDVRSVDAAATAGVVRELVAFAEAAARRRGATVEYTERQTVPPTPLDGGLVATLEAAVEATGESYRRMASHALHDTAILAPRVPSAMLFVPCRDGISHSPEEWASVADAAVAVEIVLAALVAAGGA